MFGFKPKPAPSCYLPSPARTAWEYGLETLDGQHVLIAGATGSGKSVLLNKLLYVIAGVNTPATAGLILIDPKRVELIQWRALPHVRAYADNPAAAVAALDRAAEIMETRYTEMQRAGVRKYSGPVLYVVIDELADLLLSDHGKVIEKRLQHLGQLGRAARVVLIVCTQQPSRQCLRAPIVLNITRRVALRCVSAIESRQILGVPGAEDLPRYGTGLCMSPGGLEAFRFDPVPDEKILDRVRYWTGGRY